MDVILQHQVVQVGRLRAGIESLVTSGHVDATSCGVDATSCGVDGVVARGDVHVDSEVLVCLSDEREDADDDEREGHVAVDLQPRQGQCDRRETDGQTDRRTHRHSRQTDRQTDI